MRVLIHDTDHEVAVWTAHHIAARINAVEALNDRPFVLGLPTGSTPLTTYRELIKLHKQGKVSFRNVVTFNMDEYLGLPPEHPQSYHYFMWNNFFNHIDILPENTNILNGMTTNPAQECKEYEDKIAEYGTIDLFLGGVGSDGHIAFNEPYSSLNSRTRVKHLTHETLVDNARFFNSIDEVPTSALTVGIGTVLSANEIIILATGYGKARALFHGIECAYNHAWPISALQTHANTLIVCDDSAATELKVATYRFFKAVEADNMVPEKL